jgi:hypothetical protein
MLGNSVKLGEELLDSVKAVSKRRGEIRDALKEQNLLAEESDFASAPMYPTTCGVDGSYVIEKLLTTDITAIAGLAVEGLTPPSEKRFWPRPHHLVETGTASHNEATSVVCRAIMVTMELELAGKAPHDVVFLDGSLVTPLIYLNQGLARLKSAPAKISQILSVRVDQTLKYYHEILTCSRTDKAYAGIPKYTSKNEISSKVNVTGYEDRALLSLILEPGELTTPLKMAPPEQPYHLTGGGTIGSDIANALLELRVFYYRPYMHLPALRVEVPEAIAQNRQRLAVILEALKLQSGSPSMMEPYPLYLADRMVKHLPIALPALRRTVTQEMATKWEGNIGDVYMAMHGYRSEVG